LHLKIFGHRGQKYLILQQKSMLIGGQSDYAAGAEAMEHVIKNMEYFKWDGDKFFEFRPLPKVSDIDFLKRRRKREAEISFIKDLDIFVAFITAPDAEQEYLVQVRAYEKYREKFGYFEDTMRLAGISASDALSDYQAFNKGFIETCMVIEKALSKNKFVNNGGRGIIAAYK
jgi:hypothetical protein